MSLKKRFTPGTCFSYVYLTIIAVVAVFPLLWLLVSAFKSSGEMLANPTTILPKEWTLENFKTVLFTLKFTVNIKNSLIVALVTTVIATFISSLAAYGIIRFFPRLGNIMTKILITTYMFPSIMLVIPYAVVMNSLHLTNTRGGLVLVYMSFSVPYAVWMLVGFFKTVPIGIEEAARIDGANRFQVFTRVVIPLVRPGSPFLSGKGSDFFSGGYSGQPADKAADACRPRIDGTQRSDSDYEHRRMYGPSAASGIYQRAGAASEE